MNPRPDYFVLQASDWQESNRFYRDGVGADTFQRSAGFFSRAGGGHLNLHGSGLTGTPVSRLPVQPGNSVLCFAGNGRAERVDISVRTPDGSLLEFTSYPEAT